MRVTTDPFRYATSWAIIMPMKLFLALLAALTALFSPPLLAQARDFTLVNGTGQALGNLAIRRTGASQWRALGAAPAPDASRAVPFSDPDCAFDIRAETASGEIVWSGVNLCEISAVTLRVAAGTPYAEYR